MAVKVPLIVSSVSGAGAIGLGLLWRRARARERACDVIAIQKLDPFMCIDTAVEERFTLIGFGVTVALSLASAGVAAIGARRG